MTDRLSLADAKIDRPAAERIATEIFEAIHDNVATKSDLRELEQRLGARIDRLETRLDRPETRLDGVDRRIELIEHRVVIRLGAPMVVLLGLLFAALRLLPPPH